MTALEAQLFHVGILVRDIEVAITTFENLLDVRFNEPSLLTYSNFEDPEPRRQEVLVTFSQEGPVHYELIQGQDGPGIYSLRQGEGLHHVGVWTSDVPKRHRELEAEGFQSTTRVNSPDGGLIAWYSDPLQALGVRIEYCDLARRTRTETFIATGNFESDPRS